MMKLKRRVPKKMKWRLKRSKRKSLMKIKKCVEEHEDIVNLEKPFLKKVKRFATNKPKKVVRKGGPSPLKKGKK